MSAGIVVLVLLVAFFVVRAAVQAKLNPKNVEAEISKSLGLEVHTDAVKLSWTGVFELIGLKLETQGKPFLSTPIAAINLHLFDLLHGKISVQSMNLQSPAIELDPSSLSQLSELMSHKAAAPQHFKINLSNGTFDYTAANGRKLTFNKIKGTLQLSGEANPIALRFQDASGGSYVVTGTTTTTGINLRGTVKKLSFAEIMGPVGINPLPEYQGDLNGEFTVGGTFNNLAFDSDFVVSSGLFKGTATLSAALETKKNKTLLHGKLYSGKGTIENVGAYKSFGLNFSTPSNGFVFQDGMIEFPNGTFQFSGEIDRRNRVTVKFRSAAFDPFALPNFSGWGVKGSEGKIAGKTSGGFPNLTLEARGSFPVITFGNHSMKNVSLALLSKISSQTLVLQQFRVTANHASLAMKAFARWDSARDITLKLSALDAADLAGIFGLRSQLSPMKMRLSVAVDYDHASKTWKGKVMSGNGKIDGVLFDSFGGNFSYFPGKPVDFSGGFERLGRTASMTGNWMNGGGTLQMDASGFPFAEGEFRGDADVHAKFAIPLKGENRVSFTLTHGAYQGKALPEISGVILLSSDMATFDPLTVSGVKPALVLTGKVNTQTRGLHLSGTLSGQSISSLMALAGGSASGVEGNLTGPLTISGSTGAPRLDFRGTASNLVYKGMKLGEGHLDLAATGSTLNGKLALNKPLTVNSQSPAMAGAIGQIHGVVGNILGQVAANIEISGVLLRGSPHHPEITPLFNRVGRQASSPQQKTITPQNAVNGILNQIFK